MVLENTKSESIQDSSDLLSTEDQIDAHNEESVTLEEGKSQEELMHEEISFAQNEIQGLVTDGVRRLDEVEKNAGLSQEDIATVQAKTKVHWKLKEINEMADILFGRLKEKFSEFSKWATSSFEGDTREDNEQNIEFGGVAPSEVTTEEQLKTVQRKRKYKETREFLEKYDREISDPMIKEARVKRNELLEDRGVLRMSEEDFDQYFTPNDFEIHDGLKQQNVGDCYAVAAIHAMSQSPHFEMICRSSMNRRPDGVWEVRIPLLSHDGEIVLITPEELLPQHNRQFLRRPKTDQTLPDFRMSLRPMKGKEGLQVLEAAFIKHKFGSVDRLKSEGGWGHEVLVSLGGENFLPFTINSMRLNKESGEYEYPGLISITDERIAYLDHYLENFDPEIHIATISTRFNVGLGGIYRAKDTGQFLVAGHAYSISRVDSKNKIAYIANPWNTSKPIELTFEQLKNNFSGFDAIRIDSAKLLRNIENVEEKVA